MSDEVLESEPTGAGEESTEVVEEVIADIGEGSSDGQESTEDNNSVDMAKYSEMEKSVSEYKRGSEDYTAISEYFERARNGDAAAKATLEGLMMGETQPKEEEGEDAFSSLETDYGSDLASKIDALVKKGIKEGLEAEGVGKLKEESKDRAITSHENDISRILTAFEKTMPGLTEFYKNNKDFKAYVGAFGGLNQGDHIQTKALRIKAAYDQVSSATAKSKAVDNKSRILKAKGAETLRQDGKSNTTINKPVRRRKFSETFSDLRATGKV